MAAEYIGPAFGAAVAAAPVLGAAGNFLAPILQSHRHQTEALEQDRSLHVAEMTLAKEQHGQALELERRQFLQDATKDLREASKEADRDLLDTRTERFQNLMTVSSLFLAGCFTLAVEGKLPEDPGKDPIFGTFEIVELHYLFLGLAIGLNWVTIMCSLRITSRISIYMDKVTQKQQEILQDQQWALSQTLEPEEDHDSAEEKKDDSAAVKKAPTHPIMSKGYAERSKRTREEFTKRLRKQPVVKMSTTLHADRRVGSFNRWYRSKCQTLERLILRSFEFGVAFMFLDITTYVMAHLENGDEGETHSTRAWQVFTSTTAVLLVASFVLPEVFGGEVPYSLWHDGIFSTLRNWNDVRSGICVEELNPSNVVEKAERLFDAMDIDNTDKLTLANVVKAVHATEEYAELKRLRYFLPKFGLTPSGVSGYTDEQKRNLCSLLRDELLQDVVLNVIRKLGRHETTTKEMDKNEWTRELIHALF